MSAANSTSDSTNLRSNGEQHRLDTAEKDSEIKIAD